MLDGKTLTLADLLVEKERLIAQANSINGAIQMINLLIQKLTPKEEAPKEG